MPYEALIKATALASRATYAKTGAHTHGLTLPMPEMLRMTQASGYRDFVEACFRGHTYELQARDRNGKRVRLSVDSKTGKLLDIEFCD